MKFVFRLSLLLSEIQIEHSNILIKASPPKHPHSLVVLKVVSHKEQQMIFKTMKTSAMKKEVLTQVQEE